MTTRLPIPLSALDDRLGFVGTTGSGKTYGASAAVERILDRGGRVVIPDPLGVWWGLRLMADGKTPSPYNVIIFGGPHADLPINEHAGALIGEAVATMKESAILDLSEFPTAAAERRFMLAFLTALYRHTLKMPLHLIFDEVDMWAPEKVIDKEGDANRLLGMMNTVVRRGRVRGFTSWPITQRPAVVSKNILSMVEGLISFQLTSSQDRKALGAWIEGQADKEEGKKILAGLPEKQLGEAVVWIPRRRILQEVKFPEKTTFDSSRAPKRGEVRKSAAELAPINLDALKGKLATVEAEAKANDPKALRTEITRLNSELTKARKNIPQNIPDAATLRDAETAGLNRGLNDGYAKGWRAAWPDGFAAGVAYSKHKLEGDVATLAVPARLSIPDPLGVPEKPKPVPRLSVMRPSVRPVIPRGNGHDATYNGPQMKVLRALAMWRSLGHEQPTKEMVAAVAGYSPTSGGYANLLGTLRTIGAIDYPAPGLVALATDGIEVISRDEGRDLLLSVLKNPQRKIVDAVMGSDVHTKEAVAEATGYSPTSGGFANLLGSLRTLGIIDYPQPGYVALSDWAKELL